MDAERWQAVERVLDVALDHDPAEWPAVVAEACGGDDALRREVEALLAEHGRPAGLLGWGPGALAAEVVREREAALQVDALVGARLGPWRVVRQVGQGGMARVFLGERADGAFAQQVAVKVLRAGLDSAGDVERFRRERQILATLDHPNIARLLDGGVAPDGRPYLVLEYIEGEPLTAYCDARALDVPARLRLFLAVADATGSAHRQLVVHRDLKPSNILVGGDGRPRLLDFGVATILDPTSAAPVTRRRWLTPEYAAPEQFDGAPATTATDVYQLGAVLYELLSGHRPFERGPSGDDALEARVRHADPPPPSSHGAALRGDLDAVVLKALRKEPRARYASVAELAADVQRVLDGEPVAARAGDRAYRWRRLARRRALPLSLAAAALVTIAVYVATLAVQNRRIARALAEATTERTKAEQVTTFLLGLFQASDPRGGRSDTITARTLLARGEARANALGGQPAVQAEMLDVIGRVRHTLGAYADARPSFERALALRRGVLGDTHPAVAATLVSLAEGDERTGRFAEAERALREALAIQRATLGDTAAATLRTRFQLGFTLHAAGRFDEAAPELAEWERRSAGRARPRDEAHARQLQSLGQHAEMAGRTDTAALASAERYLREALAIRRELFGPRHADVGYSLSALASVVGRRGRPGEADSLLAAAIAIMRAAYPDGHPDLATALHLRGSRLLGVRQHAEGLAHLRDAARMAQRYLAEDNVMLTAYLVSYGDALRRAGDAATAERVLRDAVARYRRQTGPTSLMTTRAELFLGDALRRLGRMREAETLLVAAYDRLAAERGVRHPQTQAALRFVVTFLDDAGRGAEAARHRALLAAPGGDRAGAAVVH